MKHRFFSIDNDQRSVHLFFSEIEFDVRYGIMKRAKLAGITGEQLKEYSLSESDYEWLNRSVQTAIANIKNHIPWAVKRHSVIGHNELLEQKQEYLMIMYLPRRDWHGDIQTVTDLVHSYICNYCIASFLEMADAKMAVSVNSNADDNMLAIVREINNITLSNPPKFML